MKTYIPQCSHNVKLQIMKGVAKDFLEMSCHFKNIDSSVFVAMKEVKACFRLEGVVLAVDLHVF